MGFWDTLKNTAAEIGNWAVNNSGTILSTVGTIAKIAGMVALTEEEYDNGTPLLPHMTTAINGAEEKLLQVAKTEFPKPKAPSDWKTKTVNLPCFWPTPTGVGDYKSIPEVAMDINRMLAMHDIPNTLGPENTDLGAAIANGFFNTNNSKVLDSDKDIKGNPVSVDVKDMARFVGGMTYYRVPMGNEGHESWHSNMRLYYQYSPEAENLQRAENRARAIKNGRGLTSGTYNATTITVTWTGANGVSQVMKDAVQYLCDKTTIKVGSSIDEGTRFTYQFTSPTNVGSNEVASRLTAAISDQLQNADHKDSTPVMPIIKATNIRTIIA